MIFITILEGESPATAEPLLATRDPRIARLIIEELGRRLAADEPDAEPDVRLFEGAVREEV